MKISVYKLQNGLNKKKNNLDCEHFLENTSGDTRD